ALTAAAPGVAAAGGAPARGIDRKIQGAALLAATDRAPDAAWRRISNDLQAPAVTGRPRCVPLSAQIEAPRLFRLDILPSCRTAPIPRTLNSLENSMSCDH